MTDFPHLALELLARGQLPQAADEARRALIEDPGDPDLEACLGEAAATTHPQEARAAVERASATRPDDAALLLAAARVQWRIGDHQAATATAKRATALAPKWAEGQATQAVIALDQSQRGLRTSPAPDLHKLAAQAAANAAAYAPDWPLAHVIVGQVDLADGNHERAATAAKTALGLDKDNPQALVLLGDTTLAEGNEPAANQIYNQARPWPPAVERLQASTGSENWLRPNLLLPAMFGALILGTITRSSGQPVVGAVLSLLGIVAACLVLVGAIGRFRRRRAAARQEVARLLTPGNELVGAAGGNLASG